MDVHTLASTPGKDYPQTWNEFLDWFATEEACLAYLERLRWPQGFVCPRCGCVGNAYRASRTKLMCPSCQHQSSVTAGTIFDKTRTPLRVWLGAAWYLTAWTMLHRLRRSMVRPDREQLKGLVEVDETYLAITDRQNPISPKGRKSSTSKVLVVMA
ncbi:MAG: IS1595 family transposase, partial [Propionivibrio sp.]|uniref:IS1595 family transposase n=1 Tax=Propionivibrio sp. TaxID=2212460 RepID=UPI001A44A569